MAILDGFGRNQACDTADADCLRSDSNHVTAVCQAGNLIYHGIEMGNDTCSITQGRVVTVLEGNLAAVGQVLNRCNGLVLVSDDTSDVRIRGGSVIIRSGKDHVKSDVASVGAV